MPHDASQAAKRDELTIDYRLADYRILDPVEAFDVALLTYYDFGVVADGEREEVLRRVGRAPRPGGSLVFDVLTPSAPRRRTSRRARSLCPGGGFWQPGTYVALTRLVPLPGARSPGGPVVPMTLVRIRRRAPESSATAPDMGKVGRALGVSSLVLTSATSASLVWRQVGGPLDPLQALQVLLTHDLFSRLR